MNGFKPRLTAHKVWTSALGPSGTGRKHFVPQHHPSRTRLIAAERRGRELIFTSWLGKRREIYVVEREGVGGEGEEEGER